MTMFIKNTFGHFPNYFGPSYSLYFLEFETKTFGHFPNFGQNTKKSQKAKKQNQSSINNKLHIFHF